LAILGYFVKEVAWDEDGWPNFPSLNICPKRWGHYNFAVGVLPSPVHGCTLGYCQQQKKKKKKKKPKKPTSDAMIPYPSN
jgi:hypothetical protein